MNFKSKIKEKKYICFVVYFCKFIIASIMKLFIRHDKKLIKYHNSYLNKKCFIVATGPSLTINDLELIKGNYSISVNSIIKSFDKTSWRPDFYLITDPIPFRSVYKMINITDYKQVFLAKGIGKLNGAIYFSLNNKDRAKCQMLGNYDGKLYPSNNLKKYFNNAPSVIFSAIQLAVYMGFKEIYLLGQDCNYNTEKLHSDIAGIRYSINPLPKEGDNMLSVFRNYSKYYSQTDVKIFNCTRGGKLDVFPRKDLEDVI